MDNRLNALDKIAGQKLLYSQFVDYTSAIILQFEESAVKIKLEMDEAGDVRLFTVPVDDKFEEIV